jgi:hypothetical protein
MRDRVWGSISRELRADGTAFSVRRGRRDLVDESNPALAIARRLRSGKARQSGIIDAAEFSQAAFDPT